MEKQKNEGRRSEACEGRAVIAFVQIDNLTDVYKIMTDETKPQMLGELEKVLAEWVIGLDGFMKQTGEGRYMIFLSEGSYLEAERTRFALLDRVRERESLPSLTLTLSMGIGIKDDSLNELGRLAQSALELALERGGDQVVVKSPEKTRFFGGHSTSVQKRTKVKVRVTALALKDLIQDAKQVMVMGHEMADYDCLGASVGLAKAVADLGKKVWIVSDRVNPILDRWAEVFPKNTWQDKLVKVGEAGRKMTEKTLLLIVDTYKPSLLADESLVAKAHRIAIIDHHRRGEDIVLGAELVYLESSASSASELVTELLQYLGEQVELTRHEATLLMTGMMVDTKSFTFQTGVRTFEAASYLRRLGADPAIVHRLLREDFLTIIKKAGAMRHSKILYGEIAYTASHDPSFEAQTLAAKTADTMLNIAGVKASFVLWPYPGGVAVSARSNGEMNVHAIMERLGGGGHYNIAAVQLNEELAEAEEHVLSILEEVFLKEVAP